MQKFFRRICQNLHDQGRQKPQGFTLVEILIVVAIMALLSIAAINNTVSTQRQFVFLNEYKQLLAALREPRIHAVTHLAVPDLTETTGDSGNKIIPEAYAAHIDKDGVTLYADLALNDNTGEMGELGKNNCPSGGTDCDYEIRSYKIDDSIPGRYELAIFDSPNYTPLNSNHLDLFYQPTYADFLITQNDSPVTDQFIALRFRDTRYDIDRYILIFTQSGIVESFPNEAALDKIIKP